ncbi:competence protein ComEC family protein, partial [Akkermansiaceae bacterium]|nr:competence protein ComEC family protein [Akkermansiaceae bacterium]
MRGSNILGRSLSLFPLWPLVLGVTFGILSADYYGTQHWVAITLISIAGILAFRKSDITLFIVTFILASGLHGPKIENLRAWSHAADTGKLNGAYTLKGVIIATGSRQNGPYLVKTSKIQATSQASGLPPASGMVVQLTTSPFHESTLQYGDIIEAVGPLRLIKPLRNPHGFDRQTWLYRQGANLTMAPRSPVTILGLSLVHRPIRIMANWRQSIRQSMTSGLDADAPSAQLIRAVVLGERPGRSSSMVEDFRKSGTLHVFAVSGLHVGMVGTIFGCLLWFLRAPRWVLIGGVIAAMTAYAGITGLRPPSVRAVIMATVFLTGFLIKRKPSLINSLGASAIIVLLWDGHQLFTPGFQLSYGVLLALAMATAFWIRILKPMSEIDPFMPRLLLTPWQERILGWRKWLRNSLSVSLAAWMGSAPLIWIHFGIVTPIAIIAGIPLMLMVFVILALAMLAISAGALWQPAGDAVNHLNSWVAKSTYHTAAAFAHIPGAYWHKKPTRPEKGQIIVFDIP